MIINKEFNLMNFDILGRKKVISTTHQGPTKQERPAQFGQAFQWIYLVQSEQQDVASWGIKADCSHSGLRRGKPQPWWGS
jgi:hypothetical protein